MYYIYLLSYKEEDISVKDRLNTEMGKKFIWLNYVRQSNKRPI